MMHIILAAILTLMPGPSPKWEETNDAFRARMELISQSIAEASKVAKAPQRRQMAMAIVVTFWGESRFSPLVQAGEHRGDGGLAICLGSNHQGSLSQAEWLGLAGLDLESTTRCATLTATRLKSAWWFCHELDAKYSWQGAFSLYATGRTCRVEETHWPSILKDRNEKWRLLVGAVEGPLRQRAENGARVAAK